MAGISHHSGAYHSKLTTSLAVASVDGDVEIALDDEPGLSAKTLIFEKKPRSLITYRLDE